MKRSSRLLSWLLPLMIGTAPAIGADGDWYVGAGGGVSRLTPDTDGSAFTLDESASSAFGVFGGREFGRRYAAELGVTRLGQAGLSGGEAIDYSVLAGGVLGYVLGDIARVRRGEATGGFLRLGVGAVSNDSDVPLEQEDNVSIWAGVGADVPIGRIWALRAELASFDGDAQAATVALVWRPRRAGARSPVTTREPAPPVVTASAPASSEPVPAPAPRRTPDPAPSARPAPAPVPDPGASRDPVPRSVPAPDASSGPAPRPPTASSGGRPTPSADCPAPSAGEPVDERGCARFAGVVDGVEFFPGTAALTAGGEAALERLAAALLAEPDVAVELRAHVAAGGDPAAEKALSSARALATARHLVGQGVPVSRLRARAFGGERPRTDGGPDDRIELGTIGR